jgi:phenylalanyl-tRNA synthetase alpha chain
METQPLPIRTISVGRVFRNETITYKSHIQFHQTEGLVVDKQISFADLKQSLYYFVRQMFGDDFKIRFRPSYFPFTEPSAEMDISLKKGETKWMEILGCGMVDPQVLDNCGIDSSQYSGFAFGMGIERIAMLKYKINDIRLLYETDLRFLEQFVSE